ncbi:rhombosortase-dependent M36 family metallopeptidase [Shewanella sedimentimangrovi]|uniref:Rhombosortase-dependent M36 family metallopeptidase n=1 Tax=Shewanella sedimentimangrovi TaxID=2814293 RepID=A0ABX7R3U0_9GAMM|nr:rhombosortase-dependent M36 family metallopeptidase [Shewanella sedimentimangrovi]QSX37768.1 rhombosortase-dependent M36 family metallopeptidase [Shewanella sedimentimangrovi]
MKTKLSMAITAALLSGAVNADNQDIRIAQLAVPVQHAAVQQQASISGMRDQFDARTGQATFQWAKTNQRTPSLGALDAKYKLAFAADFYLNQITGLSVEKQSALKPVLTNLHDQGRGGMIARYNQEFQGVEVFNRSFNIMMDREYGLVATSGSLLPASIAEASGLKGIKADFGSAANAVKAASADMGVTGLSLTSKGSEGKYEAFKASEIANGKIVKGEPRAKPVFFEQKGKLVPAQYVELEIGDAESRDSEFYAFIINSETNEVLFKHNQTAYESAFNYRVYASETGVPWDGPHGNVIPAESEDQVDATAYLDAPLVTLSHGPISTKDAWLADDATMTSGNNAFAYVDAIAPDGFTNGDFSAETTADHTFDYKYNTSEVESSVNNRKASIVNLFYMNNYLHDLFYDHGFDEASGNAQNDNYGRGGEEGDAIRAEVQDNSGFNNANMSTPADGRSPRMQMYLWDSKDAVVGEDYGVIISSDDPDTLLTSSKRASFGKGQFDITGNVVRIVDGTAPFNDGCTAATNGADLAGKIVIIDRGACAFTVKAKNAQNAGAIGVLIANNSGTTDPAPMGGTDTSVKIPAMGLSLNDGAAIYAQVDAAKDVEVHMFNTKPFKDSSWDNAIVSHEWGHYISNRLIGNGSGLINNQGRSMGEGWGDFHALLMLAEADDAMLDGNDKFQKAYAAISYVDSFYWGIRNFPYSTDMEINPLTFADVAMDNAEVHSAGEPWAVMLWDCFVSLINDERYSFDEARSVMMDYLVAGYKMTPIAPTYTEARDALLAAAYANEPKDYDLFIKAFARRGMGLGAQSPERYDSRHSGVVESYKTELPAFAVTEHDVNSDYEGLTVGYCSKDGILDKGETGTVSFTIHNQGSERFEGVEAQVEVISDHDITFANEGKITFGALELFGDATSAPIEFTLNDAKTADTIELKLTFPSLAEGTEAEEYSFTTVVNMDFKDKAPVSNMSTSDMEDYSGLADFKENVLAGGDMAEGTGMLDGTYAAYFPVDSQYLYIANNGFESDVAFETKPVQIGYGGDFTISWFQYFEIEENWDGGVVEVSVNGGDWVDVTEMGGVFEEGGYTGELNQLLPERMTYTGFSPWPGTMEKVNFGTALNGNEVRFRFRIVTDTNSNEFGWIVDNVTFENISSSVFHEQIAGDANPCDNRLPNVTVTSSAASVTEGESFTLTATAIDANADDTLTYTWTQTAGTAATLTGANTATLTVATGQVNSNEDQEFTLTVNDGTGDVVVKTTVKVNDVPTPPAGPDKSSGGSLGWLALLLLPVAALRRRKS